MLTAALLFTGRAVDAQTTSLVVSPTSFAEDVGTAIVRITNTASTGFRVQYVTVDGTAMQPGDYTLTLGVFGRLNPGETSPPINIPIIDDDDVEGDEYFIFEVDGFDHRITIRDNDTAQSVDVGGGMHAAARSEALVDNQPRLVPMLRNPGAQAPEFSLRVSTDGVDAAGGYQGEAIWGATSFSRTSDGFGEHEHLLATLGARFRMSERLQLGGMLQFDRSGSEPGGEGVTGKIKGYGWMVGPYFAFRDGSNPLYFEGRLLYGRTSDDIEDYVPAQGQVARSASLDGDRWLIQGRVEGTHLLGNGMTLIPLVDFSHAREEMEAFKDSRDIVGGSRTVAVTKLQLGAEFDIPVETASGDLKLRPGLRLVVSDSSNVAVAGYATVGTGEAAEYRGRIDFGVDYRLDDDLVLGFESFYSGRDREDFESYGAGLKLQFEF